MGLRIRRAPSKNIQLWAVVVAVFMLVAQPAAGFLRNISVNALIGNEPDLSKVHFADPKYVRENNGGDLAAQLITYSTTTEVTFYVDGDTEAPIDGKYQKPSGAGYSEWRLYVPLAAGAHTVMAKIKIDGKWYDVPQDGTVYSLDSPFANYVSPTDQNDLFRPGDNPLRLKIDDEFKQFNRATFNLYAYDKAAGAFSSFIDSFTVNRDQCDVRAAGHYLLCDIDKAGGWKELGDGSYAVKLTTYTQINNGIRTNMDQYWSPPFTIDSAPPAVSDFTIEGGAPVVGKSLTVSAKATDDNEVESINFYITQPRSDGVCTGNGAKLAEYRATTPDGADGHYRATFDVSGSDFATGAYCVIAVARDGAWSNSSSARLSFTVDHTGPVVTIQSTGTSHPMASMDAIMLAGQVKGDFSSLRITQDDGGMPVSAPLSADGDGNWAYKLPKDEVIAGTYTFTVVAADTYGNESAPAVLSVTARPYLPSEEKSMIATASLKSPSAPRFIAPRTFAAGTTAPFTAAQPKEKPDDTAVLGTETAKAPTQSDGLPVVAATESGWKVFGIAWYWWALIAAILAAGAWATAVSVRRRKVAELA